MITPFLWFASGAEDAANFYTSLFSNSAIRHVSRYGKEGFEFHHQPEGAAMSVDFVLEGQAFGAINGGPLFTINPSVSFLIACTSDEEVEAFWSKLSVGGKALMELGTYPFSQKYGWVQDKYGVSWQVMNMGSIPFTQKITPTMMFVGNVCGRAEEAMKLYASIFPKSAIGNIVHYEAGDAPDAAGTVKHGSFTLFGQSFAAMDSAHKHEFAFNEAISFMISCDTQEEIDRYWEKLTDGGEESQCGWLKDKFGFSWQVTPSILPKLLADPEKAGRVTNAFMQMKKFDIQKLLNA